MTALAFETAAAAMPVRRIPRAERDGTLLESLRRRDPDAAEQLVASYGSRAYRLAVGITGNGPDAEEAVQDAFCSVVWKIDSFRGESAFGSWLYRIVANAAYQKLRGGSARRGDVSLDDVLPAYHEDGPAPPIVDWSASVEDPARRAELRLMLTSAIAELPIDYRTALVLHDVEGLPNAEVAEALGVTVGTVKSRVHRARLFVRKRLTAAIEAPELTGPGSTGTRPVPAAPGT